MKSERQEISFEENDSKCNTSNSNENKKLISEFIHIKKIKNEKKQINNIFFHMIKAFLFEFILIILPKKVLNGYSIELKVWKTGYQQILSNKYSGQKPSAIYINKEVQILRENKVYIDKIDYLINLEWENKLTNFVDMFSDLESITSVKMNYITGYRCNMSYMFYNCLNLVNFTYNPYNYNSSYLIFDTIGMFYNCISLSSFSFDKFYMDYDPYSYLNRNMSYMFFNCQK